MELSGRLNSWESRILVFTNFPNALPKQDEDWLKLEQTFVELMPEAPITSFPPILSMSMNDFFDSSQIIESLYTDSHGSVGVAASSALPFAKQCLEKGNIASSDCRLSISKIITANANAMYGSH